MADGGGRPDLPRPDLPRPDLLRPDPFWPGSERAGDVVSDASLLRAMVRVEQAWLDALVAAGVAPAGADLIGRVVEDDLPSLAGAAEAGGNVVIPLVRLLRERVAEPASGWLHRGLTSQDVVDTASVLLARDAVRLVRRELRAQADRLAALATEHRDTPMVGRTLTQAAVPTTFGLVAATWLQGLLQAEDGLVAVTYPVQLGGAAGTMAALVELCATATDDGLDRALATATDVTRRLDLEESPPWHTVRAPLTRLGDALATCTDAWGHVAGDVLTLSRPELAEVAEGTPGGSSTMPGKANPVLATLVRRAALTTPQLAATLHLAAAEATDQRSAGPWHAEWATLRDLLLRTVVAARQTTALLDGLVVHTDAMTRNLAAVTPAVLAEQWAMADRAGRPHAERPDAYLGAAGRLVDLTVREATRREERTS